MAPSIVNIIGFSPNSYPNKRIIGCICDLLGVKVQFYKFFLLMRLQVSHEIIVDDKLLTLFSMTD